MTIEELRDWLDQMKPGAYVVIQRGADLPDLKSAHIARDVGQTEEDVLVLVAEVSE